MKIGPFALEQEVGDETKLQEISDLQYEALPKTFHGERIFRAADVEFLAERWSLFIGTVDGRIYKLSAQFISESFEGTEDLYIRALLFCSQRYGKPSSDERQAFTLWDTPFGNTIVDRGSLFGQYAVNFQSTSASVIDSASRLSK